MTAVRLGMLGMSLKLGGTARSHRMVEVMDPGSANVAVVLRSI
jgi:hypothetical protein